MLVLVALLTSVFVCIGVILCALSSAFLAPFVVGLDRINLWIPVIAFAALNFVGAAVSMCGLPRVRHAVLVCWLRRWLEVVTLSDLPDCGADQQCDLLLCTAVLYCDVLWGAIAGDGWSGDATRL